MLSNGYFSIPRSLINDPLWKSLPYTYRHVFLTILSQVCYEPKTMDDFGVLIHLKIGQLMITERELAKICDEPDIDRSLVQRALKKLENIGFSLQTTIHKKTIITVIRRDFMNICDPNFDPNSIQTRSIKKEDNKINKENKTTTIPPSLVGGGSENINLFNLKGQPVSITSSEIYKHFLKFSYSTEVVAEAIRQAKLMKEPVSNILKLLETICLRLSSVKIEKTKRERKILEYETIPKSTAPPAKFKPGQLNVR